MMNTQNDIELLKQRAVNLKLPVIGDFIYNYNGKKRMKKLLVGLQSCFVQLKTHYTVGVFKSLHFYK